MLLQKYLELSYVNQYSKKKRQFISLMPTNLYGPHDNFDEINSHVIPGLISRMHKSKLKKDKEIKKVSKHFNL